MRSLLIACFAIGFLFEETIHFGFNVLPRSDNELICDGIIMLICSLSLICGKLEKP